ncbi:MAG TPA: T9SS type A sorting domain-containing protein [Bacteroidia bacterium]|nr:T9SS type A sorting domain-containing protein [Bacteroidia bacterium]HNU32605.1 T9SS type A sorting domain-containing protein [Bacteroidia bacterium]
MKQIVITMILWSLFLKLEGQGINNIWLQGYESYNGLPAGITLFDFNTGNPSISYDSLEMEFNYTHANVSDSAGNLLFYTNGYYIADATNDTMQNGGGISPGAYANQFSDGFLIPQGALILPKPGSSTIYYMFHNSADAYPIIPNNSTSFKFYVTTIDMSLNGGLGAVTTKNVVLLTDSMNVGKIAGCKHANGRDWWVMIHRVNSNKFFKFLVTPSIILGPYQQFIGSTRQDDGGQVKFSPDGSKIAYYHIFNGLDIFDFNRCNGNLSNYKHDILPSVGGLVGCEFSPNSQLLYVSNVEKVYQYDLNASNVIASRTEVAVWDSFTQPGNPGLGAYLCFSQLAPDGKIYITTGNGTTYFGRIEYPDSLGMACTIAQHSVLLPTFNFNTLPNHPNYFLGCDTTLGCICAISTGINDGSSQNIAARASPNPTTGFFTLQFNVQSIAGTLEIYDVMGNLMMRDYVAPWSQFKKIDISNMASGIYFGKMQWENTAASVKIVKE